MVSLGTLLSLVDKITRKAMTFPWQFQKNQCEGCNHYSFDPEIEKTKNFKGPL